MDQGSSLTWKFHSAQQLQPESWSKLQADTPEGVRSTTEGSTRQIEKTSPTCQQVVHPSISLLLPGPHRYHERAEAGQLPSLSVLSGAHCQAEHFTAPTLLDRAGKSIVRTTYFRYVHDSHFPECRLKEEGLSRAEDAHVLIRKLSPSVEKANMQHLVPTSRNLLREGTRRWLLLNRYRKCAPGPQLSPGPTPVRQYGDRTLRGPQTSITRSLFCPYILPRQALVRYAGRRVPHHALQPGKRRRCVLRDRQAAVPPVGRSRQPRASPPAHSQRRSRLKSIVLPNSSITPFCNRSPTPGHQVSLPESVSTIIDRHNHGPHLQSRRKSGACGVALASALAWTALRSRQAEHRLRQTPVESTAHPCGV
jgi:hypothetical protein